MTPPLEHRSRIPAGAADGVRVAVLLHGRGSDERDLLQLADGLPDGTAVVTPRAPFPGGPWGYGPGWAWYRYRSEDRVVTETLQESLAALDAFLDALPEVLGVEPGPVVLGGFSQGGTMSLAYSLHRPGRVPMVLNFSGFLVQDPTVPIPGSFPEETRYFWGHGTEDPNIPFPLAERGRSRMRERGADLRTADYPIGHWIAPEELADAAAWMEEPAG